MHTQVDSRHSIKGFRGYKTQMVVRGATCRDHLSEGTASNSLIYSQTVSYIYDLQK